MAKRKRRLADLLCCILVVSTILIVVESRRWSGSAASTLQPQMPGPDAQQLWQYITKDNPYPSWKNFPNLPGRFLHVKENPHGDWIAAYLNNQAYDSFSTPSYPFKMAYGSIIVKENYSLAEVDPPAQPPLTSVPVILTSLTVMYKIKGYQSAPGEQEWFWVMYACNGQCSGSVATIDKQPFVNEPIPLSKDTFAFYKGAVVAGKPWLCVECHQRASQSDEFAFGDYLWKLKLFAPK
jgi:hypothetical protein